MKRVVEADDDGIVPFTQATGETPLVERVARSSTALSWPRREPARGRNRQRAQARREGLPQVREPRRLAANAFFEYHASLYKGRPIFWHIASAQGTSPFAFGALVHYHRFDKNRMAKLRASYVRDAIEEFGARPDSPTRRAAPTTGSSCKRRSRRRRRSTRSCSFQEGHHEGAEGGDRDFRILTPWKEPGRAPGLEPGPRRRREGQHRAARSGRRPACDGG